MKKSTCNLKKYHILRFKVLILVCEKKKKKEWSYVQNFFFMILFLKKILYFPFIF